MALLSVVVPTRNTREMTLRCLDAAAAASVGLVELVVVDDGSSDGTSAAVRERHPEATLVRRQTSGGFAVAANAGAAEAGGDPILFLNSDCILDPGGIGPLLEAFSADPRLGVAGAELSYPDGRPQWSAGREPTSAWLLALASGLPAALGRMPGWRRLKPVGRRAGTAVDWVTGAAMAVRRAAWAVAGPFADGYRFYGQDLELCLAAAEIGRAHV